MKNRKTRRYGLACALLGATSILLFTQCDSTLQHSPTASPLGSGDSPPAASSSSIGTIDDPLLVPCLAAAGQNLKAHGDKRYLWNKRKLKVGFMSGSPALRKRVLDIAKEWEKYSSLEFEEGAFSASDIRIDFQRTGHWSYVGNTARRISRNKQTMNLQITENSRSRAVKRVVLHEFGHAIGLFHEHQHYAVSINWNRTQVIRDYAGAPNYWSAAKTTANILTSQPQTSDSVGTKYDRKSIMHYPVPKRHLLSGKPVEWNGSLSSADMAWVKHVYPK